MPLVFLGKCPPPGGWDGAQQSLTQVLKRQRVDSNRSTALVVKSGTSLADIPNHPRMGAANFEDMTIWDLTSSEFTTIFRQGRLHLLVPAEDEEGHLTNMERCLMIPSRKDELRDLQQVVQDLGLCPIETAWDLSHYLCGCGKKCLTVDEANNHKGCRLHKNMALIKLHKAMLSGGEVLCLKEENAEERASAIQKLVRLRSNIPKKIILSMLKELPDVCDEVRKSESPMATALELLREARPVAGPCFRDAFLLCDCLCCPRKKRVQPPSLWLKVPII